MNFSCFHYSKSTSSKKVMHRLNLMAKVIDIDTQKPIIDAMLIVIEGFPAAFVSVLFTGALLIEVIFSLDGIGLPGYEAVIKRDYPILFGTLFTFTLIGLVMLNKLRKR